MPEMGADRYGSRRRSVAWLDSNQAVVGSRWGPDLGEAWGGLVARLAVTRSVRDTAALLDVVWGPGVGDPYWAAPPVRPYVDEIGMDPGELRIGWVADSPDGSFQADPQVGGGHRRHRRPARRVGSSCHRGPIPPVSPIRRPPPTSWLPTGFGWRGSWTGWPRWWESR
jgi:amidase